MRVLDAAVGSEAERDSSGRLNKREITYDPNVEQRRCPIISWTAGFSLLQLFGVLDGL